MIKKIFEYAEKEYSANPENHHMEYWKKLLNLGSIMDESTIKIAVKYLDKCKEYVESNYVNVDNELVIFPIVCRVISDNKKWPHDYFSPKHIFDVYNNKLIKVRKKYSDNVYTKRIDLEAQAVFETVMHFSKKKN